VKAIKEEFPNPVLAAGRDDYIESCHFYTAFDENTIEVDENNITIPIKYSLECKGLEALTESSNAVAAVLAKSSAASYSKLFIFPENIHEIELKIPKFAVVNKVDLTGVIIAANDISQFSCEGEFNELYFGTSTFEIRKGDILATEETRSIFVDNSELEKPISSIFNISKRDDQDHDIEPSFYGDKIEVFLKNELYDLYYNFKDFNNGTLRRYATGIIVYPVLVEAITYITGHYQNSDSDDSDFSEKRWFRAIVHKADNISIDLTTCQESPTMIADALLGNVSLDALKSFKDALDSEINSGETQMIGGID